MLLLLKACFVDLKLFYFCKEALQIIVLLFYLRVQDLVENFILWPIAMSFLWLASDLTTQRRLREVFSLLLELGLIQLKVQFIAWTPFHELIGGFLDFLKRFGARDSLILRFSPFLIKVQCYYSLLEFCARSIQNLIVFSFFHQIKFEFRFKCTLFFLFIFFLNFFLL